MRARHRREQQRRTCERGVATGRLRVVRSDSDRWSDGRDAAKSAGGARGERESPCESGDNDLVGARLEDRRPVILPESPAAVGVHSQSCRRGRKRVGADARDARARDAESLPVPVAAANDPDDADEEFRSSREPRRAVGLTMGFDGQRSDRRTSPRRHHLPHRGEHEARR